VQKLSKILRYNISSTINETVTLAREVEMVREYIYVQKIRFKDLFDVKVVMGSAAASVEVPKFILQPLVENSIHHGLKDRRRGGEIRLYCRTSSRELLITVYDNGVGMSEGTQARLNSSFAGESIASIGSIGMVNVADRLRLHFGAAAVMRIESAQGRYTKVEIRLPLETHANNSNKEDIMIQ
jgi:two-component system sensor histidine kinase YesM